MKKFLPFLILAGLAVFACLIGHAEIGAPTAVLAMAFPIPIVSAPFGAPEIQVPAYAATLAITITNQITFIQPATLTGALTVNLTIDAKVQAGAEIHFKLTSDGTARTTTYGTGMTSLALAGVISKTLVQTFVYDGTTFLPKGPGFQIN